MSERLASLLTVALLNMAEPETLRVSVKYSRLGGLFKGARTSEMPLKDRIGEIVLEDNERTFF